jgi:hypothetical protein
MAYPRLLDQLASDSTILITMVDPSVADIPRTQQANVAHDGCLQSDYVHATHWPAIHTVNGFHFPIWGREIVYSIRVRSSHGYVYLISMLQLP